MSAPPGTELVAPPAAPAEPRPAPVIYADSEPWSNDPLLTSYLESVVVDDGAPVDGILSEKNMRLLTEPLNSSWDGPAPGVPFVTMANVGLFHTRGEPPIVPDVMVSTETTQGDDLSLKENLGYFVVLRGKVPDVAVEIVSNREGGEDTHKLVTYARIRVPYYAIFDPQNRLGGGVLRVFVLAHKRYVPIAPDWLEGLGLGLKLWEGTFEGVHTTWLRWCDRNGVLIPTGAEKAALAEQRAEQSEQRAEQERQRAEQERQRAEQKDERLKRLEAQLRALGVEPGNDA